MVPSIKAVHLKALMAGEFSVREHCYRVRQFSSCQSQKEVKAVRLSCDGNEVRDCDGKEGRCDCRWEAILTLCAKK